MELIQANSSAVQVLYIEVHENASNTLKVLSTADLFSIYEFKRNKPIRVITQVYKQIRILNFILTSGRTQKLFSISYFTPLRKSTFMKNSNT
jgi:hypothetical protein